ncbi:hypothetical protein AAZX31_20G234400 [Glycine max]|uniref:Uncharacterized protein n=2 Tax=Glycine subgen. Soja TaxID=1462606 RepID=I1NJF6_SOYBN|nr:uncharacterized protein LOC100778519 [Glycine max]XP_028222566.1 uncharacterized protein LOC114403662 [Glycine soja]KAG4908746.1 hypothetical protein JHK86_057230 [Glycine max]KAH1037874.1 hypothetical protein GYH30_056944 [Glycine max]KAH1192334.1 hypothetical protein GmHk_20G059343 [Glycine max]KHN27158.1 hypothetical protein glysoja_032926 [Glycine soja]KRG93136.1 hypothetical protein GLYMA_20G249800v4 [Glycine max]|eukprot:XP_003556586.1 uncharacterized protein LOC100778519 isoform X2 [Glycine max]
MALRGLSAVAVTASIRPPGPRFRVDSGTSRIPSSGCRISVRCKAVGESRQGSLEETVVYEGIYGPWTIDDSDVREVILYRSGLVTAAASFVVAGSAAFFPDTLKQNVDLLYVLGSGGLGLSLLLIHIYVSEIKRALQALWGLGVVGSATTYFCLAQPANKNLIQYVVDNPSAVWLVGPLFAALTGLVFKEGLCYAKLEAGLLTFVIPILLLGHLTGLMDDGVKLTLLASWMTLFVIFAGRKFTQPIKDDIGDKSVFMFNSLPGDERKALLEKLEQQKIQN